jgi:hypothetical protein
MNDHDLLAILKFSLPVVAFVAAVLGMLKTVRKEGPDGEKRLNFYGRVLTGMTVFSAFISLFSAGFESILKRSDSAKADAMAALAAAKAEAKSQSEQLEKIQKAQMEAAQQAAEQAFRDRQAAAARKLEAGIVDQKLTLLSAAAEAQRRDAQISRTLAEAANARLTDTERSLAEFARINYPLRAISVRVEVELNLAGPEIDQFWKWLKETRETPFPLGGHNANPNKSIELSDSDRSRWQQIQYAAIGNTVELDFYTPETVPPAALSGQRTGSRKLRQLQGPVPQGESFEIRLGKPTVTADLVSRFISIRYDAKLEPGHEGEFGEQKLSLADARRLIPILHIQRSGAKRFPRGPDRITRIALDYNDNEIFNLGRDQEALFDDNISYVLK